MPFHAPTLPLPSITRGNLFLFDFGQLFFRLLVNNFGYSSTISVTDVRPLNTTPWVCTHLLLVDNNYATQSNMLYVSFEPIKNSYFNNHTQEVTGLLTRVCVCPKKCHVRCSYNCSSYFITDTGEIKFTPRVGILLAPEARYTI